MTANFITLFSGPPRTYLKVCWHLLQAFWWSRKIFSIYFVFRWNAVAFVTFHRTRFFFYSLGHYLSCLPSICQIHVHGEGINLYYVILSLMVKAPALNVPLSFVLRVFAINMSYRSWWGFLPSVRPYRSCFLPQLCHYYRSFLPLFFSLLLFLMKVFTLNMPFFTFAGRVSFGIDIM